MQSQIPAHVTSGMQLILHNAFSLHLKQMRDTQMGSYQGLADALSG